MTTIAIIGAGTMGRSIALSVALANMKAAVFALNEREILLAKEDIQQKLKLLKEQQVITEQEGYAITDDIYYVTSLADCVLEASFVIEAVPENLAIKQDMYAKLEGLLSAEVIIASNTSGIPSEQLIEKIIYPERFIITHFWNPAHLVPLVEMVPNKRTSERTIEKTRELLERLNKKVVTIQKEVPGFIGNRLQFALFREALTLLDEGIASKEDIDLAVTQGIGRRLPITGPLMSADFTGLDVVQSICHYLYPVLSQDTDTRQLLQQKLQDTHLGVKSLHGLYKWDEEQIQQVSQQREQMLIHFLKQDLHRKGNHHEG